MLLFVAYRLMPRKLRSVTTLHNVEFISSMNNKKKGLKPLQFYNEELIFQTGKDYNFCS
jgi:hypothetical protein